MPRVWIGLGSLAGLLAVAMAAYAAHGLPDRLDPSRLAMAQSAVQMQFWHALALLGCGLWALQRRGTLVHLAGVAFTLGLLGFCGGVYLLGLFEVRAPSLVPAGGMLLMLGWALLGFSALRPSRP